ncbi:hypothetical protein LXL04_025546 [Taraxacum kok-saghyz]
MGVPIVLDFIIGSSRDKSRQKQKTQQLHNIERKLTPIKPAWGVSTVPHATRTRCVPDPTQISDPTQLLFPPALFDFSGGFLIFSTASSSLPPFDRVRFPASKSSANNPTSPTRTRCATAVSLSLSSLGLLQRLCIPNFCDPDWYTRIPDLRLTVRILSIVINVPKDSFNSGTNTGIKLLTTVEDSSPRKIPRISENQFNVQQLSEDPE